VRGFVGGREARMSRWMRRGSGVGHRIRFRERSRLGVQRERNGAIWGGHRFGKLAAKLYPNREEEGGR
jgi:hypothetical protein